MKKVLNKVIAEGGILPAPQKPERENVWCEKFGYFIDLDACRARSMQRTVCRRCFSSLMQLSLPFEG